MAQAACVIHLSNIKKINISSQAEIWDIKWMLWLNILSQLKYKSTKELHLTQLILKLACSFRQLLKLKSSGFCLPGIFWASSNQIRHYSPQISKYYQKQCLILTTFKVSKVNKIKKSQWCFWAKNATAIIGYYKVIKDTLNKQCAKQCWTYFSHKSEVKPRKHHCVCNNKTPTKWVKSMYLFIFLQITGIQFQEKLKPNQTLSC